MLLQKQGSHLNEEISRVVLELQKDRYFETLYGRFASNMDKQISYVDMTYTYKQRSVCMLIYIGKIFSVLKKIFLDSVDCRYWNSTLRSECPTLDDSDGITLRSLGGVD